MEFCIKFPISHSKVDYGIPRASETTPVAVESTGTNMRHININIYNSFLKDLDPVIDLAQLVLTLYHLV